MIALNLRPQNSSQGSFKSFFFFLNFFGKLWPYFPTTSQKNSHKNLKLDKLDVRFKFCESLVKLGCVAAAYIFKNHEKKSVFDLLGVCFPA